MIRELMTMSPKGQVVIPRLIRKAAGLHPGGQVAVEWDGQRVMLDKPGEPIEVVAARIAKSGKSVGGIDPHWAYESELEERWKRIEKARRGKR